MNGATSSFALALSGFLAEVERQLRVVMADPGELTQVAQPLVLAPASKRARPMVAWLVGEAFAADPQLVLDAAIAVELVHSASLLHDDVIDHATERRGVPSANATWGATMAVLSGDLMLTAALTRLAHHGPAAMPRAIAAVAEMTRAVGYELAHRKDPTVTLAAWRTMAEGKTGALFGLAAALVAPTLHADRIDCALRHLGVAFQIADDVDDFDDGGETTCQDLRDGTPSWPVLVAMSRSPVLDEALRLSWRLGTDPRLLLPEVLATGALEAARAAIQGEIEAARDLLAPELERGVPSIVALTTWADTLAGNLAGAAALRASLASAGAARYAPTATHPIERGTA